MNIYDNSGADTAKSINHPADLGLLTSYLMINKHSERVIIESTVISIWLRYYESLAFGHWL
jgi:hypothetical protein